MTKGYTLEQLLTWCQQDQLIDSYEQSEDLVIILQGELRHELKAEEARLFLKRMFTDSSVVRTRRRPPDPPPSASGSTQDENQA